MFFLFIVLASLILAFFLTYFSLRGKVSALSLEKNSLFLIRNSHLINSSILDKLHHLAWENRFYFSFERLLNGKEFALAVFGPRSLETYLPELELLELEDYLQSSNEDKKLLRKVSPNWTFGWLVPARKIDYFGNQFLSQIKLGDKQQFFWQVICLPQSLTDEKTKQFKVTIRAMVVDPDATAKIKLAKEIFKQINLNLSSKDKKELYFSPTLYEDYRLRTTDKTAASLDSFQIVRLLGL